jgi:hypothetical protein
MLDALNQYIPMQAGQSFLLKAQTDLVNNLLGYVGYEVKDGYIVFTEDITATQMVTAVDIQLVVMDTSKYGDYDILPLPADMAGKIVTDCFNLLKQQLPNDNVVSAVSEEPLQTRR